MNFKRNFFGVVLIALMTSCGSNELNKAKSLIESNHYRDAKALLEIEVQATPKDAEVNFLLASCYLETDEYVKAKEFFKKSIVLEPEYKEKVGNKYYEKSVDQFCHMSKESDKIADEMFIEGIKYYMGGESKFYEDLFNRSKEIFEFDYEGWNLECKTDNNKIARVIPKNKKLIQLFHNLLVYNGTYSPQVAKLYFDRAKKLFQNGKEVDGNLYIRACIDVDKSYNKACATLLYDYAKKLFQNGKEVDGNLYIRNCIDVDKSYNKACATLLYDYANKLLSKGETFNIIDSYYMRALELAPEINSKVAKSYFEYGVTVEKKENDINEASKYFNKAVLLDDSYKKDLSSFYIEYAKRFESKHDIFNLYKYATLAANMDNSNITFLNTIRKKYQNGYFNDQGSETSFRWVRIGNQFWMSEDPYKIYAKSKYGDFGKNGLYDYTEAEYIAKNIDGWNIPTSRQWITLIKFLGDDETASSYLRKKGNSGFNLEYVGYIGENNNYEDELFGKDKFVGFWAYGDYKNHRGKTTIIGFFTYKNSIEFDFVSFVRHYSFRLIKDLDYSIDDNLLPLLQN